MKYIDEYITDQRVNGENEDDDDEEQDEDIHIENDRCSGSIHDDDIIADTTNHILNRKNQRTLPSTDLQSPAIIKTRK